MHRTVSRLVGLFSFTLLLFSSVLAGPVLQESTARPEALIKLKLINAKTKRPIAHARVEISRENSIRCVKAPCPSNAMQWNGKTDRHGLVLIPQAAMEWEKTFIRATGYHALDLKEHAIRSTGENWVIALEASSRGGGKGR